MKNASVDQRSTPPPLIFAHQKPAFERLLEIGKACFAIQRKTLPLRARTNCLLLGPTGTGKTHLVSAVAKALGVDCELGVGFLPLALSNWIILGGQDRSAQSTWTTIFKFLRGHRNHTGVVIFLDEIDKLAEHDTSWGTHIRVEGFTLLDLKLPTGLRDGEGDPIPDDALAMAQEVLTERTFIVAAGAFQNLWEKRTQSHIGFSQKSNSLPPPTPTDLVRILPREIVNRFLSTPLILPPLEPDDYLTMLETAAPQIPGYLRETFIRVGLEKMSAAIAMQQGCRFLEELVLETVLAERAYLTKEHPVQVADESLKSISGRSREKEVSAD